MSSAGYRYHRKCSGSHTKETFRLVKTAILSVDCTHSGKNSKS